jgi:hypothetical protein
MRWKRRGANLGRSRWKLTVEPSPLPSPEGTGTSRRRVDLGKEEGDDHGRRGRWWAEHGGGAPEGGGGPSLRSLPEKLGGGGLDLGRRRLSVAALGLARAVASLPDPWRRGTFPRGNDAGRAGIPPQRIRPNIALDFPGSIWPVIFSPRE